jgi:hypothetical protein
VTEPRQSQVDVIDRAFEDERLARGKDDTRAAARANAVLTRAVGNSTSAERGAWARQANDRLFGRDRRGHSRARSR